MAKKKKILIKAEDVDAMFDKTKTYCTAKLNSAEGKCLPSYEISLLVNGYFDGYSESLRGG